MKFYNRQTGETFEGDDEQKRIDRLRRRVFAWANVVLPVVRANRSNFRIVMLTLTYRGIDDWRANHIRDFMGKLRGVCGEGLRAYAWVAELQKRGAVHYHCLLVVWKGTRIPRPDDWLWPHGLSRIETARTVFYIAKYTGKEYQKRGKFPKGCRVVSVWVAKELLDRGGHAQLRLSAYPQWVADEMRAAGVDGFEWAKRVSGGGWSYLGRVYHSKWTSGAVMWRFERMKIDWDNWWVIAQVRWLAYLRMCREVWGPLEWSR